VEGEQADGKPVNGSASALMSGALRTRPPLLPGAVDIEAGTTPC
jgi:hypothetical protein